MASTGKQQLNYIISIPKKAPNLEINKLNRIKKIQIIQIYLH